MKRLGRRGVIDHVPSLPTVRVPDHTPRIPSPRIQQRILDAIPIELRGQYLARGRMGLRPSEAWRAKVEALDREAETLIVIGKGNRNRVLPLNDEVAEWIEEFVPRDAACTGALLFRNPDAKSEGGAWTASSSRRVWAAACKAVGEVDGDGCALVRENEGLRHAFGTHAADRGISEDLIRRAMGHTSSKTSRRYVKLSTWGLVDLMSRKPFTRSD